MGDADGDASTPTPEQVLEVFRSEKVGPAQVTAEIRRLADLLNSNPKLNEYQARSTAAYRGFDTLWNALLPQVREMGEELADAPLIAEAKEGRQHDEYRKLRRLLKALKDAADSTFILGGRGFADATGWAHACVLIAAAVMEVLEQSGAHNLGFSEPGPVCRVTAGLVCRFLNRPTTANAVSALLRYQRKKHLREGSDQGGNELET
jgi:hypothetical protein